MKSLYRLSLPKGTQSMFNTHIDLPVSPDGIKLALWWENASLDQKIKLAQSGSNTEEYITAWKKLASEVMEPVTEKSQHDLKDVIRSLEVAHEEMGNDPSQFSGPPNTNP